MEGTFDFDFFFTPHALPYKITDRYPQDYYRKICADMAKQTERIIRTSIEQSKGRAYRLLSKQLPDSNWMDVLICLARKDTAQWLNSIDTVRLGTFCSSRTTIHLQRFRDSSPILSAITLGWSLEMRDTVFASSNQMEGQESVWPCGVNSSGTSGSKTSKVSSGEDSRCKQSQRTLTRK